MPSDIRLADVGQVSSLPRRVNLQTTGVRSRRLSHAAGASAFC